MKLKFALLAVAAAPFVLASVAQAADGSTQPAAAHTSAKQKLARCKAEAATQKPALSAEDQKKFVQDCVAKKV